MITIWKLNKELNSWELIEEVEDELNLSNRINELRQDSEDYRAEKRDGGFSSVLEV